jgi:hypothetical protein
MPIRLAAALAVAFLNALPAPAAPDCSGDDIGSLPAAAGPGTMILVSDHAPGATWWTENLETGACELRAWVVSLAAVVDYVQTGEYVEPSLEYADPDDPGAGDPPIHEATWISGGIRHTVKTPKGTLDSSETWAKKHQVHVEALKKLYPPDPGSNP